jgi:hypothetical protein
MTDRIREFLRLRRPRRPRAGGRPRGRARQLPRLCARAAGQPRVLCGQGESRPGGAVAARRRSARAFDTASVAEIDMALAAGATPDRISFGNTIKKERDVAAPSRWAFACSPSTASRKSTRSPAWRPAPACSAASSATGAAPNGRCRASSAASPQMAVDVLEHAHRSGPRGLRRLVPCRFAAAQGPMPGTVALARRRAACSGPCPSAASSCQDGQHRRRLPDQVPARRAGGEDLRQRRSSRRFASTSATASRRPSSSRAAAWSAMPA